MTIDESGGETKTRVDHQTGTAETTKIPTGMQFGLARAIYSSPPRRHHHLPPAGPAQGETTASRAEPSRAHQPSHAIATSPLLSLPLACHIFFFLLLRRRRRRRLTFHLLSEAYLPGLYLPPGPPLLTGHCSGSSGQQQAHMVRTHGTARHHRIHSCQRID